MIDIQRELVVNAPAEDVWRVLAQEYHRVSEWASTILESKVNPDAPIVDGSPVGGRICSVPGFGEVRETMQAYNADGLTYSYEATSGLPFFVKSAGNTWSLTPQGGKTVVNMHIVSEVNTFPGALMKPVMKRQLARQADEVLSDLKYFMENGQPHPRKVKQLQKAA